MLALLLASTGVFAQPAAGKAAQYYEDALKRYEKRDAAGAIIQLKNALQVDKNLLPVHVLLGKALLANGDAAGAEFAFSEALRLGVNRAEVALPLAQALIAQGKLPQVLEDARLVVAGLPATKQVQILLLRASAYSDTGDTRAALKAIGDARTMEPKTANTWLAEVPIRIRGGLIKEALAAAEQGLKLAPELAEAHYQKGSVLHVQGQSLVALAAYEQALKLDAGHIEARLAKTGILFDLGRFKDVQSDLSTLQSQAPNEPRAAYFKALMAEQAGDTAAAKEALQSITALLDRVPIEMIRFRPQVLMLNGMAHFGLNEFEKAKPYLEQALRLQPNSPLAKILAQVAVAEPNMSRAVDLLEGYLKAHPGDGQALLMLASAHMAQGRHAKATVLMQEALRSKDAPQYRTSLGLSLMRGGQAASAITELEKSYKADPKQTFAGLALVNLYLRGGQTVKALAVVDGLVKAMPDNPTVLLVQGTAKARARDFVGAKASFEKALKLDPKLLEAKLGLARIEVSTKAFDAAQKRLRAILKEYERNVDALFEMAVLMEVSGKNDEALKWLESAVEASNQSETRANYALVAWHLRKGQAPKAMDAAKILLGKLPEDVEALQAYAAAQMANGDLAGARNTLGNASRRAGFEPNIQVAIAGAQIQAKDLPGASYALDKALSAQANYLPAQTLMTIVELQQGDPAKAERRARQIIQDNPKLAVGHNLLADIAQSRGQNAAAIESLRRAHELEQSSRSLLQLLASLATQDGGKQQGTALAEAWMKTHPKDLAVQKALADAQARAGNFSAARRSYEAALKLKPEDSAVLNNLANVLLRLKDPGALTLAERAMAIDPRNPLLVDTAGWANHIAGNNDRALQLLRDARLREPGNPDIRYHLAAVLAKAGRNSEAKEELQAALTSGDSFETAQDAKNLLNTLK